MDPAALAAAVERCRSDGLDPFAVVATAGTTNAGVIDPLRPIGELCRREGLHLHVDAAWGGPLILSDRLRGRLDGIELADSITFDAHKLLSVPMAAGVFVCADKDWLTAAFDLDPAYVPRSAAAGMDNYRLSAQFSRRFIGLKLFMTLAAAGRAGMARTIERQVAMGRRLAELLQADGWSVVNGDQPALVCFEDPAWARLAATERGRRYLAIAEAVVAGGGSWISVTRTVGRPVLRACITSYRTREQDLQRLVEALREARASLNPKF
jgi:glutamate/tyrosine decarboxylase-like PLP-dependent enzyme